MKNILTALLKAQKEIRHAQKNSTNPHFKNHYADLESVIDACKEPLNNNGLMFYQLMGKDEYGHFVETVIGHESGETLSSKVYLEIDKQNMQGYGSAVTYARRYGLQSITGMAAEDDDGNEASKPKPQQKTDIEKYNLLPQEVKDLFETLGFDHKTRIAGCIKYNWNVDTLKVKLQEQVDLKLFTESAGGSNE